jgi:hypothetical protein
MSSHTSREFRNSLSGNTRPVQNDISTTVDEPSQTHLKPENVPTEATPVNPMWNPIWLSKTCLLCFAASFFLLALAVIILYVVSVKRSGLVTQAYSYRYTWTYGPTAGMMCCLFA